MIGQAVAIAAMAAQLLLGSLGYVQADYDPRFYALPGVGVGPFWIGESMELASFELWKLTGFAHDAQGRPAVFVDTDGNLCTPDWLQVLVGGMSRNDDPPLPNSSAPPLVQ